MKALTVVGYFVNWAIYGRNFFPYNVTTDGLTHINYAFANIQADTGKVVLSDTWADLQIHVKGDSWNDVGNNVYGNVKQLFILKKKNRNLKTLLSIGGWTYSVRFPQATSTAANRINFAQSTLTLIRDLGFDGVDIDWEYPNDETEALNFVLLLQNLREVLDNYTKINAPGYRMTISIACPAGPQHYQFFKFKEMDQYIDMWNLMAYDYSGAWDTNAGHQANWVASSDPKLTPFSTSHPLLDYTRLGIAPEKINVGMPLYAHGFFDTEGPGKPYTNGGPGTWETGIYDYKVLPQSGATEYFDSSLLAGWSYDANRKVFMSYDTPASASAKARVINNQGLGGAMFWELSADKKGDDSLVKTTISTWGGPSVLKQSQNLLNYPKSPYANLRKGFN